MEEKKEFKGGFPILCILLFFMVSMVGSLENPGMQVIIEHWAPLGVSVSTIRMMSTVQSLFSLPLTILIGTIVGKRIKFRTTAIIAVACIAVGGVGPFFFNSSWTVVLCFRGLIGIGVGLCACRTALLLSSVPFDLRSKYMSLGQALSLSAGLISGPIVGMLSDISWRHIFLINTFVIPIFFFMFFIKEPEFTVNPKAVSTDKKVRLQGSMFKYAGFQMIAGLFSLPIIIGISTYVSGHQLGSATLAGTILVFYSLGCVSVSGLSFVQKIFKRFTMPFCYCLCALADAILVFFPNVVCCFIAIFVFAFGYMGAFSLMQVYNANAVPSESMPMASSVMLAFTALGSFISVYVMNFAHSIFHLTTDADSTFCLSIFVYIAMAVFATIPGLLVPKTDK